MVLDQSRATKIVPRPISSGLDLAAKEVCVVRPNRKDPAGTDWR